MYNLHFILCIFVGCTDWGMQYVGRAQIWIQNFC